MFAQTITPELETYHINQLGTLERHKELKYFTFNTTSGTYDVAAGLS